MNVYFDNAATTPLDPEVFEAMSHVMKNHFGNPSSIHSYGRQAKVLIEEARQNIASYLKVSPSELIFTSGGTEAINTAIVRSVEDLNIDQIITSPLEHHAVLNTLETVSKKIPFHFTKIDSQGNIDLDHLKDHIIKGKKSLVVLMHANNEIGNLLPIKDVSEFCVDHGALFLSDTVQTMGKFVHDFSHIPLSFATCSAHKFHGPKGVGFLYLNSALQISPLLYGGGQERAMRSGTENIYGIVGMAKAFEVAHRNMEDVQSHIRGLKAYMVEQLKKRIPGVAFNGESEENGLYTILNVAFPDTEKTKMLQYNLDIVGVATSGGSACASGATDVSHVLKALNIDNPSLRFSFSKYNTKEEVDYCISALERSLQ